MIARQAFSSLRPVRRRITTLATFPNPPRIMKTNLLGSSGQAWTEVCLGSMTWGIQNSEAEAHEQLDYAIKERGVNCIDTAELYPVPPSAPGWESGTTERYIGTWLASNPSTRPAIHIATKVAGYIPSSDVTRFRTDPPAPEKSACRHDEASILAACDASLRRLQTDYIDVYQLHWPDRYVPIFGPRAYDITQIRPTVPFAEIAGAMKKLLEAGKIRAWGLSNETAWGVAEWLRVSRELDMPPPVSIQNMFSLTERSFEGALAEACAPDNANLGLLPWSILGGGALTGKFRGKNLKDPEFKHTRMGRFPSFQERFLGTKKVQEAIDKYAALAEEEGISLTTLAHAFCKSRFYIPSTIIGATSVEQLKENIDAFEVELDDKVLAKIDAIHDENLDPVART